MIKKIARVTLSLLLTVAMLAGLIIIPPAFAAPTPIIEYFKNPDMDSKPMARMWFPDAYAGADDNDFIEKQILELADKGFGGVEVAMLADGVSYGNAYAEDYGWGTENWIKVLKKVLLAAQKRPGFQVDITITAHWPPTLNTIDPNDDAANQQLSYSYTKITQDDITSGELSLKLPEMKEDVTGSAFMGGGGFTSKFMYTDTFVAAAVAKVTNVVFVPGSPGMPPFVPATSDSYVYTFDFGSLESVTKYVDTDGGEARGIPDAAYCTAKGWNYNNVIDVFGVDPVDPAALIASGKKIDADGNKLRFADWQDFYTADLSALKLSGLSGAASIEAGDWVIISTFRRGTGQTVAGGRIMHNGYFVSNYFNEAGTKAITDYWDAMFAADPELLTLMKANPSYIFEDSIESSSSASYWSSDVMGAIDDGYKYKDILPIVAAGTYLSSSFMGSSISKFFTLEGDGGLTDLIYEDYNTIMADLYRNSRVAGVSSWAHKTIGWGFRGQTYHLPGLEIAGAAMLADVAETDNMAKGDGIRYHAGTVNITDRDYLTQEALTGISIGMGSMADIITELGQNYSDGVNRAILHGTPYTKTFNGYNSDWPGYLPFGPSSFGDAYTYRQPYWEDITTETGWMARTQAILQKGTAKIDVAVLIDKEETFDFTSGNRFQSLLDKGYSYNLVSEATLGAATVAGGIMAPDGPAFKALIVDVAYSNSIVANNGVTLSGAGIDKLIAFADAGLKIVLCGELGRAYGTEGDMTAKIDILKSKPTVSVVSGRAGAAAALAGITPYASYDAPQLETTLYADPADGTNYYYMFNNAFPGNGGMMSNAQGDSYKGDAKAVKNVTVTLTGEGVPYMLDAMNGNIRQVGAYTCNNDGTVTFVIDELRGGDSVIFAVTKNTSGFPAPEVYVESVNAPSANFSIVRNSGALAFRANTPAAYEIKTSDNITKNLTVAKALTELDLSGINWDLTINSYSPAYPNASGILTGGLMINIDPSDSIITPVDLGSRPLGKWRDIPYDSLTQAQKDAFGQGNVKFNDLKYVSGTGEYSLTFETPGDWDSTTGAYLDLTYGIDQVGQITVNGVKFPANNASDRVDIGSALHPGANTIEIRLSTTIYGRMFIENSGYATSGFGMGGGFMGSPVDAAYFNGLLTAKLIPYTQVELDSIAVEAIADIRADEASVAVNNPVSYTVSLDNKNGVGVVELSFTFSDDVLDKDSLAVTPLNGFDAGIFPGLSLEYIGSGIWKGTVKYMYPGYVKGNGALDVLKISATAINTGPATITLTGFAASGDNGDGVGPMPSIIRTAEATVIVGAKPAVYSKYDLNKDGSIDETDLLYLIYFYQWNDRDPGWATDGLYDVYAKDCDFQVNGKVDLADMIELTANYGVYDPYAW